MSLILHACAVCFGPTDFQTKQAITNSIWFMVGITAVVLGGLTWIMLSIIHKVRRLEQARSASESVRP